MRRLNFDLEEIRIAMQDRAREVNDYYLDKEKGRVIALCKQHMLAAETGDVPDGLEECELDELEMARRILGDVRGRYVRIPEGLSDEGYELMVAFASTVADIHLREGLARTMRLGHALEEFEALLREALEEWARWLDFRRRFEREDVTGWLRSIGIAQVKDF